MLLARRNCTTTPFDLLRTNFDRLLSNAFDSFEPAVLAQQPFPAMSVWEAGDAYVAEAEVPGMKLEDIEVTVVGNELTLKGKRELQRTDKGVTYHREERVSGEFTRMVTLPSNVDSAKVEATLDEGVLTIRMPKREEAKARKVDIRRA